MIVSSLVSGSKKVSLNVACAKMTANRKKTQIDSAISAGVLLRFFFSRVGGREATSLTGSHLGTKTFGSVTSL